MSKIPHIPRRTKAHTITPEQARASLVPLMLAEIWEKSKKGGELVFGARDYNAGCDFVAPGRALLTQIAGPDWEDKTTSGRIHAYVPETMTFDDILTGWLQMAHGPSLPTTKTPFAPHAKRAKCFALLLVSGHLVEQDGKLSWTDAAAPALIASGKWTTDGASKEDLQTARAKASAADRREQLHTKALALLDSMPATLRAGFETLARRENIFACYDFLYACYERPGPGDAPTWRSSPRHVVTPSAPGRLNRPGMGTEIAAQMYDIASGGVLTTLKTTSPRAIKDAIAKLKGRR